LLLLSLHAACIISQKNVLKKCISEIQVERYAKAALVMTYSATAKSTEGLSAAASETSMPAGLSQYVS
jgi:hypothetical protein